MRVLKATKSNIMLAAQIVKKGGLAIYPTETVYGLGCDPFNIEAVKRILKVKNNRNKPLPVLASNMVDANRVAFVSKTGKELAAKFWPGPLTLIFPKKSSFPDVVTFGLNSVGLRIPNNNVALRLIRLCGGLLIGSSANRTGEKPPRTVQEISGDLKEKVDVVLDGGTTTQGTSSTVADLTSEKPKILRKGPISFKEILDVLALDA
jgi:L-threonylcarbamoyladenylate synthase